MESRRQRMDALSSATTTTDFIEVIKLYKRELNSWNVYLLSKFAKQRLDKVSSLSILQQSQGLSADDKESIVPAISEDIREHRPSPRPGLNRNATSGNLDIRIPGNSIIRNELFEDSPLYDSERIRQAKLIRFQRETETAVENSSSSDIFAYGILFSFSTGLSQIGVEQCYGSSKLSLFFSVGNWIGAENNLSGLSSGVPLTQQYLSATPHQNLCDDVLIAIKDIEVKYDILRCWDPLVKRSVGLPSVPSVFQNISFPFNSPDLHLLREALLCPIKVGSKSIRIRASIPIYYQIQDSVKVVISKFCESIDAWKSAIQTQLADHEEPQRIPVLIHDFPSDTVHEAFEIPNNQTGNELFFGLKAQELDSTQTLQDLKMLTKASEMTDYLMKVKYGLSST